MDIILPQFNLILSNSMFLAYNNKLQIQYLVINVQELDGLPSLYNM